MYGGSAELCQVLSRAAAVAGGINILGRGIKQLSTHRGEGEGRRLEVQLETGEIACADWVIGESSDLARGVKTEVTEGSLARGIYITEGEINWLFERKYATENISPASAVVVVPGTEGVPIYIVARSAATGECPKGQCEVLVPVEIPHALTSCRPPSCSNLIVVRSNELGSREATEFSLASPENFLLSPIHSYDHPLRKSRARGRNCNIRPPKP